MKFQEALVESTILQKTNVIWNKCRVNHPWSVGYTSYLIAEFPYEKFDDWVSHYLNSGDTRDLKIDLIPKKGVRKILRNPIASKKEMSAFQKTPEFKTLNLEHGRSWEAIENRVLFFQNTLSEVGLAYTYEECAKVFMQRVIIDTWNGQVREWNTVSELNKLYPDFQFVSSDAASDFNYGIDFNIFKNQRLIAAIQIKPISYRGKKDYIAKAKKANEKKWQLFKKEKGVKVFLILSDQDGVIQEENGLYNFLKNYR